VHTHLTHASLGPLESISQTASRSVLPFLHSSPRKSLYFTTDHPISPLKISPSNFPFTWDPDPYLTHGSFSPPESQSRIGISIGSASFAEFTIMTDRPTDRQTDHVTPSVTMSHIYVVLKCGLTIFQTISNMM